MRKVKFAFLFVLVLCLAAAVLVACNPTGGTGTDTPTIPVTPDNPVTPGSSTVSGSDAWDMLIEAARESNTNTDPYVWSDAVINLGYAKNGTSYTYALKVRSDIDLENAANSQALLELWKVEDDVLTEVVVGLYYYDSNLVFDCTGLKSGATVVNTDHINLSAVVETIRGLVGDNSLAQFLLNHVLTMTDGIGGVITGFLPGLFGQSRVTTREDGSQRIEMPIPLSDLLGGALSGLLSPGALDDLLPEGVDLDAIFGMVEDVLGIDLTLFEALQDMSLYLVADLTAADGEGVRELSGVSFNVGLDFDTYGTSLEGTYGAQQTTISISVGGEGIDNNNEKPRLDVSSELAARGIDVDSVQEYSPLTFDLTLSLNLGLNRGTVTPNELMGAFGTLFTSLIPDGSLDGDLAKLLDTPINIEGVDRSLKLHLMGTINMFDNSGTSLLLELTGADEQKDVRARIAYVGADETAYVDLTGLIGAGKFHVEGINLNDILGNAVEYLVGMVKAALYDAGLTDANKAAVNEFVAAAEELVSTGRVVNAYGANSEGEPIQDVMGLIQAIIDNIDVDMENIFNINSVQVTLTQAILDYIWSLVFTGNLEGAKIPIAGDVVLELTDNGFASTKDIKLDLALATGAEDMQKVFASLGVGISVQFGSVIDPTYYQSALDGCSADRQNGNSIRLATLEDFLDLDVAKMFSGVESIEIGMQADVSVNAIAGDLADITYSQANDFMVSVLAAFEESFGADGVLTLRAELTDVAGLIGMLTEGTGVDVGAIVSSLNVYLELAAKGASDDAEAPLRIWLVDGVLYLDTSDSLLGGLSVQVDLKPFFADAFSVSEAVSAEEPTDGSGTGTSADLTAWLLALVGAADINLGDLYLDVAATAAISELLGLLGVGGLSVTVPGSDGESLDLSAGISINFNDGLQLSGSDTSEGLSASVSLGLGSNFGLDLTIGGINAVINGESNIEVDPDVDFVDFFNEPYVNVSLSLGLDTDLKANNISLGEGLGSIIIPEGVDVDLKLSLDAKVDLGSMLSSFTGVQPSGENETELALRIVNTAGGGEEVLLAAYYSQGILYVDAGALIGARVSTELDIMELLDGVISAGSSGGAGGQAVSAADPEEEYSVGVFEFLMKVTSDGFVVEVAEGLTQVIVDLIGVDLGEIDAALSLNWSNITGDRDENGNLLDVSVSVGNLADVRVTLSPLTIGIGRTAFDEVTGIIPDDVNAENYKNIGSFIDENNQFSAAGLELDSVYAALSGTVSLSASADGAEDWTIGEWINNFTQGDANIADNVKSLIQKLVLSFVINRSAATSLEFDLRAMLRFPDDLSAADAVGYILSHSDIALEIRTPDMADGEYLLAVYLIAGDDGRSTLYVSSSEGGIIGGNISVPGISLGDLFASGGTASQGGTEGGETAVTAAECTTHTDADGDGVCDVCGAAVTTDGENDILSSILSVINRIYMTNEELTVGFGANFLASLLNLVLPGYELDSENFIQLDSSNSFLSVFYGKGEGTQRDIGLELSIAADPFAIGLTLGGLGVAVNDDSYGVLPEDFDASSYMSIFDRDGVVSLSTNIALELALSKTENLPDGELPVGDMLSAIISNLALELGVKIEDDLTLGVDIGLGANIYFADAESTEIVLEIRDRNNSDENENLVLAVYIRGSALYVDMGMLSEHDFVFENTAIVSTVLEMVNEALGMAQSSVGSSEAVTASGDGDEGEKTTLDIVLEVGEGHIALNVTEAVLLGIIGAVAGTDVDIESIFAALNLGAEVSVDVDFDSPSVSVNVDTNYASIGLAIENPYVSNSANADVTAKIDGLDKDAFQSYESSSVARFGLNLSVEYSADATYELVGADAIGSYPLADRYVQLPDGTFVQDNDGMYIRRGVSLSDIIDALLDMPALGDALGGITDATLSSIVNMLVASLGLELYIDDPIGDNLDINITGLLDLEALGLSDILGSFVLPTLDTLTILNALQAGVEIVFNPENTSDSAAIGVYLMNGYIYLDLSGIGGPRISADLFTILEEMDVPPFAVEGGGSEAVTAADGTEDGGSADTGSGVDVNEILNALVRSIVIRTNAGSALEDGSFNLLTNGIGLDLMLPSNLLGNIVSLITGTGEEYRFNDFILDEKQSGISLNLGGGNGIELVVSARSNIGFDVSVSTHAGIDIDVATSDDVLLTDGEVSTYIDMTDMVFNIVNLVNGNVDSGSSGLGSQRVSLSISGRASFTSDGEGSYDVGSLLGQYLEDLVLEINTDEAFTDGIAFRLSVAADLGKIGFAALADPDLSADEKLEQFLATTDLNGIEVAFELLDTALDGNIMQDKVLAGIYLYNGYLYLDGTDVFDVVDSYAYVPNFLRFVIEAAQMGAASSGTGDTADTQAYAARAAAVAAADGDSASAMRDALIELVYSDTAMQIVLTKSIISAVLATLLPDLGSLADIFDDFEVSLGAEIGKYEYVSIYEAGLYKADKDAEAGTYVAVTDGSGAVTGFRPAQDGDEGDRYTLTPIAESDGANGVYYAQAEDGTFYRADARYNGYSEAAYTENPDGTGTYVKLKDDESVILDRDRYTFYQNVDGNYVMVLDIRDVEPNTTIYVRRGGGYPALKLGADGYVQTYDRKYGYVREENGTLYRTYDPYTALSEFYLALGAEVGTMNVELAVGGITLGFGGSESLLPGYILEGKTKTPSAYEGEAQGNAYTYANGVYTKVDNPQVGDLYYYDVPLTPFYDTTITIGASVEVEIAITEGQIDVGEIFSSILGDLEGIVIQIPETNKGYSSAHLRLDATLMLDMQDLPSSELAVRLYNLSSESGAEVQWLAAYYMDDMLYIDLSFFNMPKLAVPMTEISDWIEEKLGELLNSSIYDDAEVGSSSSAEAITADDSAAPADTDEAADLTTEERVASLLVSERRLSLSIGNALMRYLLSIITINGDPIGDLVYDQLKGGLDVTIDVSNGLDVGLDLALMLEGDRYTYLENATYAGGERYFVFRPSTEDADPEEGLFILDEEGGYFREASARDLNEGVTTYVRYEAAYVGDSWKYYSYDAASDVTADGTYYVYDAEADVYTVYEGDLSDGAPAGVDLYTRTENEATGLAVYLFESAASANPNDYDTELNIYVGVNNVDMYFSEQREYSLTPEELKEYYDFNSLDTVSLSETISLDLLFAAGSDSDIDLSALFEYLFPDSSYDFDTIIGVVSGSDEISEIVRGLNLTVSLEFKLGAFINYLRSLDATYPGGLLLDADGNPVILPEEFDLVTFIELIMSLVGKKDPDNPADDLFGLEDFLYFVNASVELTTTSNDGTPEHPMLGVYLSLGSDEGTTYDATNEDHDGQQRYSHYYASDIGGYGYVEGTGYVAIGKITGYDEAVHGRYAYDASFLYPDANGDRVRDDAGLYVDLSYLGQPGVFLNLTELTAFIAGMMNDTTTQDPAAGEAITADETSSGSGLSFDLGSIFGEDVHLSDSLPLLTNEISAYIRAFVYGVRITSTYIRVLLQADFLDQLLTILTGDFTLGEEFQQSYIGINVDVNNYMYAPLADMTTSNGVIAGATYEQLTFADTRFTITEDADGMYYVRTDALTGTKYFTLRSDMAEGESADTFYNITPVTTYIMVDGSYILTSDATRTEKLRAERYSADDAATDVNPELEGTYKFYVTDAALGMDGTAVTVDGVTYYEIDPNASVWAVYPDTYQKPFIEAQIWLWDHSVGLGINMPTTSAAEYRYENVGEGKGDYDLVENVIYTPDETIEGSGNDYLYYRGHYYLIEQSALRVRDGGGYRTATDDDWSSFLTGANAYNGTYYLNVRVADEGFRAYIPVNRADVYEREVYKTTYTYVGADKGSYKRLATSSLVTVPEFHVDFNAPSDSYVYGDDTADYYVDSLGNLTTDAPDNYDGTVYKRDDFTFVHSTATGRFVSVTEAREAFLAQYEATYDTDGDGVVDADKESEFTMQFAVYIAENYDTDEDGSVLFYDGDYIRYADTGELYYINVTIRGSISLSQHKEYLTEENWLAAGYGADAWDDAEKYALVRGQYVPYNADEHAGLEIYGAHTASSSAISNVLGAILGDMDALFTVADGYEAVLPFEIRATVKLDYANETDYDSLYVAGLELAVDLWRTEADDSLTHVLGIYYMSDVWNIGDNNDANDIINSSALYLDLSWIAGPSAKFKVDLSQYSLEELLNDELLSQMFGDSGTGASEAVTAAEAAGDPDKATVLLNVFSRSIALKASAGFLKLVIDLIAPDMTATLEEMLPNLSVNAQINAAPYDLTIGATLYDGDGTGLLDLGITLNLFNTEDKTEGLQLDIGSLESYAEISAARLAEKSKDYMYYYGMFSRVDSDYVAANSDETYYIKDGTEKGYRKVENNEELQSILAAGGSVFVFDDEVGYDIFVSATARDSVAADQRYAEVPEGYVMLEDADDYAWATGTTLYVLHEGELTAGTAYYVLSGGTHVGLNAYYFAKNNNVLYTYDGSAWTTISSAGSIDEAKQYYLVEQDTDSSVYAKAQEDKAQGDFDAFYTADTQYDNKGGLQLYHYYYNFGTHAGTMRAISGLNSADRSDEFIDYDNTGRNGYAKLYVRYSDATGRDGADAVNARFGITSAEANSVRYMADSNGAHKQTNVFANYQTLLSLDLEGLLNTPEGEKVDVLGMLIDGLAGAGLSTVEIGGTLKLDLTFDDVLNWTRQMTRLMEVDGQSSSYFSMLLASLAMNSAEFVSAIGLEIDLALQLNIEGLIEMLPQLTSGATVDVKTLLPAILGGAKIYMEIAINTNFYGDSITGADPIQLWIDVTDDLYLNIYLTAPDLGEVTGLAKYDDGVLDSTIGDFFAQGIKIENLINLGSLLATDAAGSEAVTAADSGLIIDIGTASTGLLPEDIWGVLNLILGQALFAQDMISVGITEDILAGLIAALVPEFPEEDLELLPTFAVTSGSDTSGINLLFGDGSLALQVQLGIRGGFDDFTSIQDAREALGTLIGEEGANVYGIDSYTDYFNKIAYLTTDQDDEGELVYVPVGGADYTGAVQTGGNAVVISTKKHALAAYASPNEAWLGARYEITGFENGEPVFTEVKQPYGADYTAVFTENAGGNGLYGKLERAYSDYQGMTGGQVTEGTSVTYGADTFMLVSRIEKLTGQDYTGTTYDFDEDAVDGAYVLLGDVTVALELGDISLSVNQPFSAPTVDSNGLDIYSDYTDVTETAVRISTEIDLGFWGNTGASIQLGELADLIFGIDALKTLLGGTELVGNDLDINITGDLGSQEKAYFTVRLDGYLNLADYSLQVKLEVLRGDAVMLAVYLADDNVYADLSGLLGTGVQGKIVNLGLTDTLAEALGGVLGGAGQSEAVTAAISHTADLTLRDYAYLAVLINPGYFSLQLTLATIEAIIAKVGADNPDLALGDIDLPDLGIIEIESYGDRDEGSLLSLNIKMSEDFGASLDVKNLYIGTEPVFTSDDIAGFESGYTLLYDVESGEINQDLNISLSASAALSMTSDGLQPGDDDYDNSLAGWVIELLTGLLGNNAFFVSPYSTSDSEYNAYGGPVYIAETDDAGTVTYVEVGKVASDGSGYYAKQEDGTYATKVTGFTSGTQYYRTTMIEATFAANDVNLTIELEADLNMGALISYGISGILLSDLRVSVGLGTPFNTTILEVYYLGSSRLAPTANNNIYELREAVKDGELGAFNDAIYIDASGLGLGKIKFSGIAGILGANIGQVYDSVTASDASSAADETGSTETTDGGTTSASVSLGIDFAENYIGLNIDNAMIRTVFGLLMPTLESAGIGSLPDVQSLGIGLTFKEQGGLSAVALDAVVDGAGTGLHLTLSDLEISLDRMLDTTDLVSRVQSQFAGITYSGTAGAMTLLQSLIDGIDPNLSINIDRRANTVVQATSGSNGNTLHGVAINRNGSLTITSTFGYYSTGGDGMGALGGGTKLNDYAIRLDLSAVHPDQRTSGDAITAKVYFGNNNLMLEDLEIGLGALSGLGDMLGIFNWIDVGSLIGGGQLFPSFAYNDADNSTWSSSNPIATTASDGAEASTSAVGDIYADELPTSGGNVITDTDDLTKASSFTTRGAAATNVDGPYKYMLGEGNVWSSGYSYNNGDIMSILNGLVNKVEVNLFNKTGYQPYISTMPDHTSEGVADTDASLISIKIELNKDAYNELLIFLYTTILSLFQVSIDINGNNRTSLTIDGQVGSTGAKDRNEYWYFTYVNGGWLNDSSSVIRRHESMKNSQWVISNLFRELDSIDYMNLTDHEKTVRRVQLLDPYVRSLPVGMLMWLLLDMVALGNMGSDLSNYGALFNATSLEFSLGDASIVIASLLPTFADYADNVPNPSLNLYIDLDPQASFYGYNDSRTIAPGIQAIELMVNVEKSGGGKTLAGVNDSYKATTDVLNYVGATGGSLHNGYVLSINPRNLTESGTGYSGEGLFELLEADSLNGNLTTTVGNADVEDLSIEVTDVGSKNATMYNGNIATDASATPIGSAGTLNAEFLTSKLPTEASVNLVGQSTQAHTVPVTWDASAIDLTPSADDTPRLAGFVYGYALNLVVAKIPVYISGNQNFSGSVQDYSTGSGTKLTLTLDGSGRADLPDLVRIGFTSGGQVFGTQYYDAAGNAGYAVRRVNNAYPTNSDGTYNIYPAYNGLLVTEGGTPVTYNINGTDYYVIDTNINGYNNGQLPVGVFSWDISLFDYGWDGGSNYGTAGNTSVTVGITYQWGFSASQTHEITVPVTTAYISSTQSNYQYQGESGTRANFNFNSWSDFATAIGTTDAAELEAKLSEYFAGFGEIVNGSYITASGTRTGQIGTKSVAGWDLSALLDALVNRQGSAVSVDITMFVGGFSIWRQYDANNALIHGMMDDVAIEYEGTWVIASTAEHHAQIIADLAGDNKASVAQPVTVTVTIRSESDFTWGTEAQPDEGGEGDVTTFAADTYAFSDGTSTVAEGDVQTYEITTSAQLYGAMPESGAVVSGSTGATRKAAFDWNGFVYDTEKGYDVARLSVTSGGTTTETDVIVTLADNAEVGAAADVLDSANAAGTIRKIVDARYRAMSIDPFEYATFREYLDAEGFTGANIEVVTDDGRTITVTVTSWSNYLTEDSALPLAGARYNDNTITATDGSGNTYTAVVPLIVNARTVTDTEIVLHDSFSLVSTTRRFSNLVRRYNGEGQVVEVSYSLDTLMPTAITVYNAFAFADSNPFAVNDGNAAIDVTFADGDEVKTYGFVIGGLTVPTSAAASTTLSCPYEITYGGGSGAVFSGTIEVTFSALRINANNIDSDIAYNDLGGTEDGRVYFAPYDNMVLKGNTLPTPYGTDGTALSKLGLGTTGNVKVYVDGMFVTREQAAVYTAVAEGAEAARYTLLEGRSYNASGNSYVLAEGDTGAYVYVYAAAYVLDGDELTWDHSGITYNYNGGYKRTTVSIAHAGVTGSILMPVYIASGRITKLHFVNAAGDGSAPDYSAYFGEGNTTGAEYFAAHYIDGQLVFDPADGLDPDALIQVPGEDDGVMVDGTEYVYFPAKVGFVTADGATVDAREVTWSNLASIRNTYRGGEFGARLTVPAVTSEDGKTTYVAAQGFTAEEFVKVEERTVIEGTDASSHGLQAVETSGTSGPFVTSGSVLARGWADRSGLGTNEYIDPYDFDIAEFRTEAEKITAVTVEITGVGVVRFSTSGLGGPVTTDDPTPDDEGYMLAWNFTSMSVNYLGGRVALIAELTGPDGGVQTYEIDYLVQRKVVSNISGYKGGTFSSAVGTDVSSSNFGRAITTDSNTGVITPNYYEIDPYSPASQKLPTGWNVTFAVSEPVFDVTTGEVTGWTDRGTESEKYSYITVIMPATAAVTVDNAVKGVTSAGDATMQIDGGQRIRIPVSIMQKKWSGTYTASSSTTLPGSTNGFTIVWYGKVSVPFNGGRSTASYDVTLVNPTGGNITVPVINGKEVTYTLTAYIGAVVDASGKVLDWTTNKAGERVPAAQGTSTNTIEVTVKAANAI